MRRKSTSHRQIRTSIMDLPNDVIVEILLKIAIKSIISCRCVCKGWRVLISNPLFVKAHSVQAKATLFLRYINNFYLMERPEDEFGDDRCTINPDTKLKIPLCCTHVVLNNDRPKACNLKPENQRYKILNSCNGFICLGGHSKEPVAVCNPITREFLTLPKPSVSERKSRKIVSSKFSGIGFSPKHNQYKVFRTFALLEEDLLGGFSRKGIFGEILTLEKGSSWRSVIDSALNTTLKLCSTIEIIYSPTYIHGALHWLTSVNTIAYIDLDTEKFDFHSLPPHDSTLNRPSMTIGALESCLCVCDFSTYRCMDIWLMKEYGVSNSWTKFISIDHFFKRGFHFGDYQALISYSSNGTLLMFHSIGNALIYYHDGLLEIKPFEGPRYPTLFGFEAVAFTPSLISLRDVVLERVS
ncbi:hypothetical protein TIFTF001_039224 [Ficus carica]|uniref:F-box domain-containing protein n=1 Tax=Ficus carica TaxID=3494 RepID=A0AA88EC02_FICCA|nr:hypothetical protein TIFTF001_039224 [Ficus carica]